jgi:hypothetical protein
MAIRRALLSRRALPFFCAATIACAALVFFGTCRVHYGAGCDSSSYVLESLRIRNLAPGLALDPSIPVRAPLAPLCMVEHDDGAVVSFFPPGFPLLLAAGGAFGRMTWVTPLLGTAMALAIFGLVRTRVGGPIALLTMAAWVCSPQVFWGSTQLMSDLPAAAFVLFSWAAFDRGRPALSGALLGFAIGIRPTSALLAVAILCKRPTWWQVLRMATGAAFTLAILIVYVRLSRGPAAFAYGDDLVSLDGAILGRQLAFLLGETLLLNWVAVLPAMLAVFARPRVVLPFVVWFGAFVLFYSFWHWPFDAWWWTRYTLPAAPALYLLAAEGAGVVATWLAPSRRVFALVATGALVTGYGLWGLFISPAKDYHDAAFDERYPLDAAAVSRLLPPGSLVGSLNHSGPLRLYAREQSFLWCHVDAPALLRWALATGRAVYTVLDEQELQCNAEASRIAAERGMVTVAVLPSGKELRCIGQACLK